MKNERKVCCETERQLVRGYDLVRLPLEGVVEHRERQVMEIYGGVRTGKWRENIKQVQLKGQNVGVTSKNENMAQNAVPSTSTYKYDEIVAEGHRIIH